MGEGAGADKPAERWRWPERLAFGLGILGAAWCFLITWFFSFMDKGYGFILQHPPASWVLGLISLTVGFALAFYGAARRDRQLAAAGLILCMFHEVSIAFYLPVLVVPTAGFLLYRARALETEE